MVDVYDAELSGIGLINAPTLGNGTDILGQCQCNDVRLNTVDN